MCVRMGSGYSVLSVHEMVWACVGVNVCVFVCMYLYLHVLYVCIYIYICVYIYVFVCIYVCMHVYMYGCYIYERMFEVLYLLCIQCLLKDN